MGNCTQREVIVSTRRSFPATFDDVGIVQCGYGELFVAEEFVDDAQDR